MSSRFNLVISDDLNKLIDKVAADKEVNKSEIIRKSLSLYLSSLEAASKGLKVGFFDPTTEKMKTEIIGL